MINDIWHGASNDSCPGIQYSPTVLTVKVKFLTSQLTNSACNQGF